jgi:hypothetical protein
VEGLSADRKLMKADSAAGVRKGADLRLMEGKELGFVQDLTPDPRPKVQHLLKVAARTRVAGQDRPELTAHCFDNFSAKIAAIKFSIYATVPNTKCSPKNWFGGW